jgi:uncharacterized membrane protein YfcA
LTEQAGDQDAFSRRPGNRSCRNRFVCRLRKWRPRYGFSSLTVPLALVFYTNRILNPAVVLVEVFINFYLLFINRKGVRAVLKRIFPIVLGLLPGIAVGASILASVHPGWIKFVTYAIILPLILLQAAEPLFTGTRAMPSGCI